jgi:hypothetical protein
MFTKPLTHQSITTLDTSRDMDSISRLLVAAAVNPGFCATLLANPQKALQSGFGGEGFPLSEIAVSALMTIQASTLPELALELNKRLANLSRVS